MRTLQRRLNAAFRPAARKDPCRRAREEAKRLARQHGVEIERLAPGANVWPPAGFQGPDPYEGDHYAQDWAEALAMVRTYAGE